MPSLESLLAGISRPWTIKLISNIQNKLVGRPFYNPNFVDEQTAQIDVPRFFFGPGNTDILLDVIHRYKYYAAREEAAQKRPMRCAAGSETPLLLLKHIMAKPENVATDSIPALERNLYCAFMVANELTMNREQGELPYAQEDDLEMYLASLMMARYAYNDFISEKTDIDDLVRNQNSRTIKLFNFICNHPQTKDLYDDFLEAYGMSSWKDYLRTYWSILSLARYNTGVINFETLKDKEQLLSEQIVKKDSIDINEVIPLEDNIDYVAFRERPFIKVGAHEYAVIDMAFMINRMYDGLYFIFNDLWQKKNPVKPNEFNRIFTTEFSEETVLVDCLKDVANTWGWFSLTDGECKSIVPEKTLSSPPDFYIRDGKDVILVECKDVKIPKEVKAEGTIQQLLDEVDKDFVGYQDEKGRTRHKGVGQLVRNAKRIQDGRFAWDDKVDKDSRLFLVLVLADSRQVEAGWKNYLNRRMLEECACQSVDKMKICPLILTDLGTITLYKNNFKEEGFLKYFDDYYQKTTFDSSKIFNGDMMTNIMNQTMSFGVYMNGERNYGGEDLRKEIIGAITKHPKEQDHHSYRTKTLEYADFYDDEVKDTESYLSGINKRWLIEGVVHMISVDSFESYSMKAESGLMVMFQNYMEKGEVTRLFRQLTRVETQFKGIWLTLVNHQALYRLLRIVLMLPNEYQGIGESFEAYEALLKAMLAENSKEMKREKEMLSRIRAETEDVELRDAMIIMQQDMLNVDKFGENKKELEKSQMLKFLALHEFGKEHKEVGEAIKRVVKQNVFKNEFSYLLLAQMPLAVYHDTNNYGEGLYFIRRNDFEKLQAKRLWNEFVSYVADKHIDVWDTESMRQMLSDEEMQDNTCFRKYPVLKFSDDEYLIASQPYYTHLFYDGFWWSVKAKLKSSLSENTIMKVLTKDFSEKYLFYDMAQQMVGYKRIRIFNEFCFDEQQPSPDISIRTRKHLYMFEFKDMRVMRDVADGSDMAKMMAFIDDRLNKEKQGAGKNKGLTQLVSDMESFYKGEKPWYGDYKRGNMRIHPILVVNSRLFGVRGINFILQRKLNQRIEESAILSNHKKEISDLVVMDYDMLVLVSAWSYKDFARFHHLYYSFITHIREAQQPINRCASFRHYVMNKWESEMTEMDKAKFKHGYKEVVRGMMKLSRACSHR